MVWREQHCTVVKAGVGFPTGRDGGAVKIRYRIHENLYFLCKGETLSVNVQESFMLRKGLIHVPRQLVREKLEGVHFLNCRNDSLGSSGERIVTPDLGKKETAILETCG